MANALLRPTPARALMWWQVSSINDASCTAALQWSPPAGAAGGMPRRAPTCVSVWQLMSPATDSASAAPRDGLLRWVFLVASAHHRALRRCTVRIMVRGLGCHIVVDTRLDRSGV